MKALLLRDLRLAIRTGGGFGLGLAFFFLLSVLVPLGVGPEGGTLGTNRPGDPVGRGTSGLPSLA
jgi:heme exporter protein B